MNCANLMKALRMWIYCASVAAKLSIHGFRSPLILIEVIDRNGSEELLNPSGQKQLHMTNFTLTLKAVRNFSNSLAVVVAFVAIWTATFRNYTFAYFLMHSSLFDFNKHIVWYDDKTIHQKLSNPLKTLISHCQRENKMEEEKV